mmetsp:Transcript_27290/g.45495  ORF Transcript_27290/g.45495 Transcript_27290/m.45495 type:complete len:108 (+) Transcript_27290:15-338(+)
MGYRTRPCLVMGKRRPEKRVRRAFKASKAISKMKSAAGAASPDLSLIDLSLTVNVSHENVVMQEGSKSSRRKGRKTMPAKKKRQLQRLRTAKAKQKTTNRQKRKRIN